MGMMLKLGLKWFLEVVSASDYFRCIYADVEENDMAGGDESRSC